MLKITHFSFLDIIYLFRLIQLFYFQHKLYSYFKKYRTNFKFNYVFLKLIFLFLLMKLYAQNNSFFISRHKFSI